MKTIFIIVLLSSASSYADPKTLRGKIIERQFPARFAALVNRICVDKSTTDIKLLEQSQASIFISHWLNQLVADDGHLISVDVRHVDLKCNTGSAVK